MVVFMFMLLLLLLLYEYVSVICVHFSQFYADGFAGDGCDFVAGCGFFVGLLRYVVFSLLRISTGQKQRTRSGDTSQR